MPGGCRGGQARTASVCTTARKWGAGPLPVAEEADMRQELLRGASEFGCHGDRRPGVVRREPGGSVHRILNVVALPPQPAVPVERGAELTPDGDLDGVMPASRGDAQSL